VQKKDWPSEFEGKRSWLRHANFTGFRGLPTARRISVSGKFSLAPGFSPVFRAHGDSAALAAYQRLVV